MWPKSSTSLVGYVVSPKTNVVQSTKGIIGPTSFHNATFSSPGNSALLKALLRDHGATLQLPRWTPRPWGRVAWDWKSRNSRWSDGHRIYSVGRADRWPCTLFQPLVLRCEKFIIFFPNQGGKWNRTPSFFLGGSNNALVGLVSYNDPFFRSIIWDD